MPAAAGEPPWPDTPYSYTVVDQDLRTVLKEFGTNLGLNVQVSDEVKGRVRGRIPALPPREFLSRLASTYSLVWYYDGTILDISTVEQMSSRLLALGSVDYWRLRGDLERLDIFDPRFPLRYSAESNLLSVSGPPRYVARIEQTLGLLAKGPQKDGDKVAADRDRAVGGASAGGGVRVFRGRRGEAI